MRFKSRYKTLIGIVLALSIYVYFNFIDDGVDRIEFDSAVWKNTPAEFSLDSIRLRMVDDFLNKYEVIGMDQDEIIALLGKSDDTSYFKDSEMVYCLGQEIESYFGMDSQWLIFDVSDENNIVSFEIVTD